MNSQERVSEYDQLWTNLYGDMQNFGPVHRHMRRILRSMMRTIEYNSFLDVGCGLGHNLELLCEGRQVMHTA